MKCWHVHIRGSDSFLFIVWEQNEFLQWNLLCLGVWYSIFSFWTIIHTRSVRTFSLVCVQAKLVFIWFFLLIIFSNLRFFFCFLFCLQKRFNKMHEMMFRVIIMEKIDCILLKWKLMTKPFPTNLNALKQRKKEE